MTGTIPEFFIHSADYFGKTGTYLGTIRASNIHLALELAKEKYPQIKFFRAFKIPTGNQASQLEALAS